MIKYDTIIIGGGLSGLTCALYLSERGQKCAVISTGQNALSCSSGAMNLLSALPDGTPVEKPIEAINKLPSDHPYSKIGAAECERNAVEAQELLARAGVKTVGSPTQNHMRITPMGTLKSCWLSLEEQEIPLQEGKLPWSKVAVFDFIGFMDFNTAFAVEGLERLGAKCTVCQISLPAIAALRNNASEMRSTNIARVFADKQNIATIAKIINDNARDAEAVMLPAVFGLKNDEQLEALKAAVTKPLYLLPTLPPSVPGTRISELLTARLRALGCTVMAGDTVVDAVITDNKIEKIHTEKHTDIALSADHYVLCTGDFFSCGIVATSDRVIEPAFNLDVTFEGDSSTWGNIDAFATQPYQMFGIKTDASFRPQKGGATVENLYAAGAILDAHNALKEGCGAGVALLTAMEVAKTILNKR